MVIIQNIKALHIEFTLKHINTSYSTATPQHGYRVTVFQIELNNITAFLKTRSTWQQSLTPRLYKGGVVKKGPEKLKKK